MLYSNFCFTRSISRLQLQWRGASHFCFFQSTPYNKVNFEFDITEVLLYVYYSYRRSVDSLQSFLCLPRLVRRRPARYVSVSRLNNKSNLPHSWPRLTVLLASVPKRKQELISHQESTRRFSGIERSLRPLLPYLSSRLSPWGRSAAFSEPLGRNGRGRSQRSTFQRKCAGFALSLLCSGNISVAITPVLSV